MRQSDPRGYRRGHGVSRNGGCTPIPATRRFAATAVPISPSPPLSRRRLPRSANVGYPLSAPPISKCLMPSTPPNLRYYRALVGRWSGRFELRVTDGNALAQQPLFTRLVGFTARFGGRAKIATTLDEAGPDRFLHTTRVTRFGLTLLRSRETIALSSDGSTFIIQGWQRFLWRHDPYRGEGQITADASGAHYPITWLGAPMTQTTRIEGPDNEPSLRLVQQTVWSAGEVLLKRQS